MLTGKEDLLQSLIEAYLMEKGTKEFYSHASLKALNPEAKKTFHDLSDWEEKHMDFIQYIYQSINDDRELKGFEDFKAGTEAPLTEAGIPVKNLEEKIERHEVTDENSALTLALQIEGKAYNLYRKLSENAVDGNAKVIFTEMMEQELKHIDYLNSLRAKLA